MSHLQDIEAKVRRDRECLLGHGETLSYRKGQDIFYQGHDPCGIYWIVRGDVSLIHVDPKGDKWEERKDGAILGLEELLKGEAFRYTARAVDNCQVCFIPKIVFLDWLEKC